MTALQIVGCKNYALLVVQARNDDDDDDYDDFSHSHYRSAVQHL